ncbi:type III sulfide quinone reductase, selenoprotein subtype [Nitratidesulfovibrio liaohensis]|uniref:type III sulfide quinone reductase, selenoprotein subtype n=1 Tax=Nitratidesulfovibrio liaohensis TaxID=2604158 RepID=UPI001421B77E|nr:FAD/NAD(P)-binding oxidoreductase [Nitratidesulfovibrio liaohensis]NHZ46844.1 NAD(P)/FAD-dependent oxidoreductase [Nitratidesulfovibrio liaohensis]
MKKLLILGAGAGGTMLATKMRKKLSEREWEITVIDRDLTHHYQPGWLFIPFGIDTPKGCEKPKKDFIPRGVNFVQDTITNVDPEAKVVTCEGGKYSYDWVVIATGCRIAPDEVEGLLDDWRGNIHDFYTPDGAAALLPKLKNFKKGRLVHHICETPIKCPVAPLEFIYLADWYFTKMGVRDNIEIELVTPLTGAFTKPVAAKILGELCEQKNIKVTPNFVVDSVDAGNKTIASVTGDEIDYDLLVTIPPNMGQQFLIDSDIADPMGFMDTDKGTLKSKKYPNMYVIGDTTNVPTSKAGSVAHYEADIIAENLMSDIDGSEHYHHFDGHSTCFIVTGYEKASLIDFSYDVEPLPGMFPFPGVGPCALLGESHINYWGKLMFKWVYYSLMLKGHELPFEPNMYLHGKDTSLMRKK